MALHMHPRYWGAGRCPCMASVEMDRSFNWTKQREQSCILGRRIVACTEAGNVCALVRRSKSLSWQKVRSSGVHGCHCRIVPHPSRKPYRSFCRKCRSCSTEHSQHDHGQQVRLLSAYPQSNQRVGGVDPQLTMKVVANELGGSSIRWSECRYASLNFLFSLAPCNFFQWNRRMLVYLHRLRTQWRLFVT